MTTVPLPKELTLEDVIKLKIEYWRLWDENLKRTPVYSKEIDQFLKIINSKKINIPKNASPKEIGIILEQWYEILERNQATTTTEIPQYKAQTTTTSFDMEAKLEEAERRNLAIKQTQENAKRRVQQTQDRLKEINVLRAEIQKQIEKAQELQPEYEGKKVYATVTLTETLPNLETQQSVETLTEYASHTKTRTELIDQVAIAIETRVSADPLFARTLAVQIVDDLANPETITTTYIDAAIEETLTGDQKVLEGVLQNENTLTENARMGTALTATDLTNSLQLPKDVAETVFGQSVANAIYNPTEVTVTLDPNRTDRSTHEIDLGRSNQVFINKLKEQDAFLEKISRGGIDHAKDIYRNQLISSVNSYLAKAPKGSILGNIYSSDAVKAILTKGSPNALKLKYFGNNRLLQTYFKYSPESMPYFKLFTEVTGVSVGVGVASKIVPLTFGRGAPSVITTIQPIKSLAAPYTLGVKKGAEVAIGRTAAQTGTKMGFGAILAKGAAAIGISSGVFTFGVSTVVTTIVIAVGKLINWPKIKKWFQENAAPLVGVASLGGLMIGGPVLGGLTLLGGLAATGTTAVFAAGAFRFFSYIGRSIGVTIATPVIVTLIILPPLVAFIMLVINNSAYVVPPSISTLLQNQDNLYIEVSKIGEPSGPFENSQLPITVKYTITVKAKKGPLTNISFEHNCKIIQESRQGTCSAPEPQAPDTISPTTPFTFEYEETYSGTNYNDSLVLNVFSVTADSAESQGESTSGSETIIIGDPPTQCLKIEGGWPSGYKSNIEEAIAYVTSEHPNYIAKVCAQYPDGLPLTYNSSSNGSYWGWFQGSSISFYQLGVKNVPDAIYTLAHELVHALIDDSRSISIYLNYLAFPGILQETPRCFYSYNSILLEERLADATAFAVMPNRYCSITGQDSNISHWPKHKTFVENNILK